MKLLSFVIIISFWILPRPACTIESFRDVFEGTLKIGKKQSSIFIVSEETGDLAVLCFRTKSIVGKRLLAKCRNKKRCRFTGNIDWSGDCGIKGNFSATGRIVSVRAAREL